VILLRKMWRDLLLNKAQFISIFFISLLAVGFYTGITAEYRGMDASGRAFFAQTHLATAWIYGEDLTTDDLAVVKALEDVQEVERALVYETHARLNGLSAQHEQDTAPELTLHYREGSEVNGLLVQEGAPFAVDDEELWLDARFAEARGLAVGDSLSFEVEGVEVDARIAGLVYSPELVYPDLDDALTPDYGAHGFAYTGAGNFPLEEIAANEASRALRALDAGMAAEAAKDSRPAAGNDKEGMIALPYNQLAVYAPAWEGRQYELEAAITAVLGDKAATVIVQQNHRAFMMLQEECKQHAIFADIFPVLFMFIAVLVMLSTMSRLVSKQSTLIGTMKALGVRKAAITAHYIGYGFIITLAGGLLGAALGPPFIPRLFLPSMTRFFTLPEWQTYREPLFFILPLLVALAGALVSWLSCRRVLAQKPAAAMRPRAPRAARHSPLEALPFWRKLGPNVQLNERDIRRNKLRSAMSVIGSLGVSALLMVAFLCWTTVNNAASWQYESINNFSSRATLVENISDAERDAVIKRWGATPIMERAVELRRTGDSDSKTTSTLQVFESSDLIRLTDLKREFIPFEDNTVYLSNASSKTLGLSVGDRLEWRLYGESSWHETSIDVINRNPMVQGLTLSPATLEGFGVSFEPSSIVSAQTIDTSDASIQGVVSATEISEGMDLMLEAMLTMAVIMIIAAVFVGVFIMYNLGTLTFSEMERELATLKVVGFKRWQIITLLASQNVLLSLVGFIPGIPLGWLITEMMLTATGGAFDYATTLYPGDMALDLAVIITLCLLVSLLFVRKVARLDMVSSLKCPE
jgi:putative ABC transport system permease protein